MGKKVTQKDDIIAILSFWHKDNSTDPEVLINAHFSEFDEEFKDKDRQEHQDNLFEICRLEGAPWASDRF